MKLIYNIALGLNSWGMSHDILALPEKEGGMGLAQPRDFLLWHHLALFVQNTLQPHTVPQNAKDDFEQWAKPRGVVVPPCVLQFFQPDVNISWETMPYMVLSAKAFSLLWHWLYSTLLDGLAYCVPLWHNPIFHNSHVYTYSCPALIRCGIMSLLGKVTEL